LQLQGTHFVLEGPTLQGAGGEGGFQKWKVLEGILTQKLESGKLHDKTKVSPQGK